MGIQSLRDLDLAGVKWELSEHRAQNTDNKGPAIERPAKTKSSAISGNSVTVPPHPPTNANSAARDAANAANKAEDMDALHAAIAEFPHPLKMFAKNTVLPQTGEKLLILTDAPSSDDEESGRILSGAPGELFYKMMGAIGLSRDAAAICPVVFWRPPGGRTPTDEELAIAEPFVNRAIELTAPRAILTLGTLAAKQLAISNYQLAIFSIPHPNYLLLKPDAKRAAWEELQKLLKVLEK
ncbi:MAG: uracil-DNA glycosylase [Alphaproteobacteria bacterium]|nr:uracil-DNA glycosylase [Alphaproteobacteria bacterium]